MYVCICNALTDRRLAEAMAGSSSRRPEDAHAACGCRAKCGRCIEKIAELLRNQEGAEARLQGAD